MALLVSVALFGLLATAIAAYGYGRYAKPTQLMQQLDPEPAAPALDGIGQPKPSRLARRVQAIGQHAPVSPEDALATRRTLISAGYRNQSAVALLYGIKVIVAVALAILSIIFRDSITVNPVLRIVLPVAATVGGYWIPGFILERQVSKRQERLRLSLPDGLDLMVVSVEAGLGLDQAIQNVGRLQLLIIVRSLILVILSRAKMAKNNRKVIISCAITGSVHTPTMSEYLPVTPSPDCRQRR